MNMIHKHFYLILFGVVGVVVLIVMAKSDAGNAVADTAPPSAPTPVPVWLAPTVGGGVGPWPINVFPYPGKADQNGIGPTTYFAAGVGKGGHF